MEKIGAFEAKTHLSRLLQRVAQGERFVITKHGVPVAFLGPVTEGLSRPMLEVIDEIRSFQKSHRLGEITIKELIEEGRL
jgi:prevent-host-death family protein